MSFASLSWKRGRHAAPLVGLTLTLALGCSPRTTLNAAWQRPGRTHALLLNGGGQPATNYQSHLQHVRSLVALLRANGVRAADISIFSADGTDPAADLATKERPTAPDLWLLPRAGIGALLRPPTTYVNSVVDGFRLQPARKDALGAWFAQAGARLHAGDTLLFYVTDHGEENKADHANNTITLWNDTLSVAELSQMLARLDPGVRVVMLMSQCFSGSFAHLISTTGADALPAGNRCGYFAVTGDRFAYGCYPENRGKDSVGHSYQFFQALAPLGRFPEAHRRVLVTDDTPDVPHTSTDFFLDQLLQRAAHAAGRDPYGFIDDLLAEAWQNRAAWEPELRLLDRIGRTFGTFSPRSLAELDEHAQVLPEFSQRLATYADRWDEALEALKQETLQRFIDAHPGWRGRLDPAFLKGLDEAARRTIVTELLAELVPFMQSDGEVAVRLGSLRQKADQAAAASYRAEVRLGVVLRMRAILTNIAGRVYVARSASPTERATLTRLTACEDLQLTEHPPVASAADLDAPPPFPALADEQRVVEAVMPAWMGIQYRPVPAAPRQHDGMEDGAVLVAVVYPHSPATAAGLQVGDIILGPPGAPFKEPHQVREWTMYREIGRPERLNVLRDRRPRQITIRPGPFPLNLPKLPGPPKVGSLAPPLHVDLFRGATQLVSTRPRLLFFWATWCMICHSSLPEVLAFGAARDVEIVAITDEDPDTLRQFLQNFHEPFPAIIATDTYRRMFQTYGVSGTPTFVLVDANGIVRHYQAGYTPSGGLTIEGWHWSHERQQVSRGTSGG